MASKSQIEVQTSVVKKVVVVVAVCCTPRRQPLPMKDSIGSIRQTSGGIKEWAIVELQGDLEVRTSEDMHDQFVGDLYYNKYGQPILIIGHHILQGREQKLEKPFAVLEKSKTNEGHHLLDQTTNNLNASVMNSTVDRTFLDNTVALENKSKQRTEYTVQAIVTKKLTFKSRPKPIIANVAKSV